MNELMIFRGRREDIPAVSFNMRPADIEECRASGSDPETALLESFNASEAVWTIGTPDSEPVGMFGVTADGEIWMLACRALSGFHIEFIRRCRGFISNLLCLHGKLHCWSYSKNTLHHRWLEWSGFTRTGRTKHRGGGVFEEFHLCAQ